MTFIKITSVVALMMLFSMLSVSAQEQIAWDNTKKKTWSDGFKVVNITSSADGAIQNAYLYKSKSKTRKPLIISLHTWSGTYKQSDPIINEIVARDWNYIHPDFRGANRTPESMGSPLVIADIEDAIAYALKQTNADPSEVHVIGVSGGGLAALIAYMNVTYPVKSFSAWAAISDLNAWYWESVGRDQKYAKDVFAAVSSKDEFNTDEALRRSPLFQSFPQALRKDAKLYIYEGIHDGYTGSVPITHSINMYNRLVGELKYGTPNLDQIMPKASNDTSLVSEKEIINLVTKRCNPTNTNSTMLFDRVIHLSRNYKNISLTIFEGGHEQIPQALGLLPVENATDLNYNILTLGDSNGQHKEGWVDQLKYQMPKSNIVNISRSGRTIGFDNNGDEDLNALRNIDRYLDDATQKLGKEHYDFIIVCLGTNDTKSVFSDRQDEVAPNFESLLEKICQHPISNKRSTKLIFVTPPAIRSTNISAKYEGGNERLNQLFPKLTSIAVKEGFIVVDIYHPLQGILDYYAADGIHMHAVGQQIIASQIVEVIRNKK